MKNYITFLALCLISFGMKAFAQNNEVSVDARCFEVDAKNDFVQDVVTLRSGREFADAAISINLTNTVSIYSMTFDLELPKGVGYVNTFKYGERIPTAEDQDKVGGENWVLYHGDKYNNFILTGLGEIGTEGEILQLNLKVSNQLPSGTYPIRLKSFRTFGGRDFLDDHKVGDVVAYLTVKQRGNPSFFLGNAYNSDEVLDLKDPYAATDMILGKTKPNSESDVNWDGNCTIGDLVRIIEMIKNQK